MAAHLDLEEQEQLEQVKAFWKRWGNLITWLITAALAAFAAWQGWNWYQRDQAAKASAMYEEFDRALAAQDLGKATAAAGDLRTSFASTAYATQASLQIDAKAYDDAAKSLDGVKAPEFAGLVADRRGDLLLLQDKRDAAKAEYQKALAALDKTLDYRRIVEAKLATLGVPTAVEATGAAQ